MAHDRIVVGFDDTPAARQALDWAVREAARRDATVLVVTAWQPSREARLSVDPQALRGERLAVSLFQRRGIEAARAGLAIPPRVGREIVLADPVTALTHAAAHADLVVIGDSTGPGQSPRPVAGALVRRLARRRWGTAVPLVVVSAASAPDPTRDAGRGSDAPTGTRSAPATGSRRQPVAVA